MIIQSFQFLVFFYELYIINSCFTKSDFEQNNISQFVTIKIIIKTNMKDYTFSGRLQASSSFYQQGQQGRMSSMQNSNNLITNTKNSYISETDKKIDEIKRKYDTPNRRQRFSQLSSNKKQLSAITNNNNYTNSINNSISIPITTTNGFNDKQNFDQKRSVMLVQSRNCLKESFAINRQTDSTQLKSSSINNQRDHLVKQRMEQQYRYQRQSRSPYNQREKQQKQKQNLYKNQTQQEFFSRVKRMKQSLFCPDTKRSNINININNPNQCTRSQYSQYDPSKNSRTFSLSYKEQNNSSIQSRSKPPVQKDRIDNIDKINQKIKGILECLNQNQKVRASKYGDICNMQPKVEYYKSRQREGVRQREGASTYTNSKNHTELLKEASGDLKKSIQMPHLSTYSKGARIQNGHQNHRHKQSQLLQKIQIARPCKKNQKSTQNEAQNDRWQRISTKLEKYQLSNKGRFQKAFNRYDGENQENDIAGIDTDKDIQAVKKFDAYQFKPKERSNTTYCNQRNQQVKSAILQKYNRASQIPSTPAPQKNNLSFYENTSNTNYNAQNPRTLSVDPRQRDHIRSRSFIATDLKRDRSVCGRIKTNQNYQLQSGKKLNEEIDKIQLKIQQFQQQKKKLNIQFKPFSYSNSKSTANLSKFKYEVSQKKISQFNKYTPSFDKEQNQENAKNFNQNQEEKNNKQTFRVNEHCNGISTNGDISFQNRYNKYSYDVQAGKNRKQESKVGRQIEIKLQKSRQSSCKNNTSLKNSQKTSKFVSQDSSNVSIQHSEQESFVQKEDNTQNRVTNANLKNNSRCEDTINDNGELRKRTYQGIQQRKRRLQQNTLRKQQTQMKELVRILCDQVKLDQELRNGKLWLQNSSISNKFQKIKQKLAEKNVTKSIQNISSIFSISESENNPFFTTQDYKCSLQRLVQAFLQSDQHWSSQVMNKFDKLQLQKQGFDSHQIDLQRKGHIQLQDLVRFLNLNSGSFFRNRDVVLIFKRIHQCGQTLLSQKSKIKAQSGQWIDFQWLLCAIAKK